MEAIALLSQPLTLNELPFVIARFIYAEIDLLPNVVVGDSCCYDGRERYLNFAELH